MKPGAEDLQRQMMARLEAAERRLDRVPARWAAPRTVYLILIGSGNAITSISSTTYYGLKAPASPSTSVPTLVPSSTPGALPDGLTRGTVEYPDGSTATVWIGQSLQPGGSGTIYSDYVPFSVPANTPMLSRTIITMPCDAGGTAPVYLPFRAL